MAVKTEKEQKKKSTELINKVMISICSLDIFQGNVLSVNLLNILLYHFERNKTSSERLYYAQTVSQKMKKKIIYFFHYCLVIFSVISYCIIYISCYNILYTV